MTSTNTLRPDFFIIPRQLLDDRDLEQVDRFLYGAIYWFEKLKDGRCFASNETLANLLHTSPRVIQNSLTQLEAKGYITRIYKDEAKRNRAEIKCTVYFAKVSPTGDSHEEVSPTGRTRVTHRSLASDPQVTRVVITKENTEEYRSSTPSEVASSFFSKGPEYQSALSWLISRGVQEDIANRELAKFISYWTEPTRSGRKVRWELERTFEVKRRLATWLSNLKGFSGITSRSKGPAMVKL